MQNMLSSTNSCRVYSLLEQNILVAVVVIFSIFAFHSFSHPWSPPSHPSTVSKSTELAPLLPASTLLLRESFQQILTGKRGWCLGGMLELQGVVKAERGELARTCSDTSPAQPRHSSGQIPLRLVIHCKGRNVPSKVAFCQ